MKILLLIFVMTISLFAHKINLFVTNSADDEYLEIYGYFGNAKPCINCTLLIEQNNEVILKDVLDENGKYKIKLNIENATIVIDAGSGHIAKQDIVTNEQTHKSIEKELKDEEYEKYYKILLGLIIIFILFFLLKKIKK